MISLVNGGMLARAWNSYRNKVLKIHERPHFLNELKSVVFPCLCLNQDLLDFMITGFLVCGIFSLLMCVCKTTITPPDSSVTTIPSTCRGLGGYPAM